MPYKNRLLTCFSVLFLTAEFALAQTNLKLSENFAQDIGEGETQSYRVSVRQGEFVRILVEQKKSDVKIIVTPPNQEAYEVDNSNTREEAERFSYIAETSGDIKIEIGFVKDLAGRTTDKSYEIRLETQRYAAEKDRKRLEAERLYDRANLLRFERDAAKRRESLLLFQKAIALFAESEDKTGEAFSHYATGQVLGLLTELNEAKKGYDAAIAIFRRLDLKPQLATVLYNSAPLFYRLNDVAETLSRLTEAETIYRKLDKKAEQARVLNGFAIIYSRQNQPRRAIETQLKALQVVRAEGDKSGEGLILRNIGTNFSDVGEPQKALEYYEQSLAILQAIGDSYLEAGTLNNLADYYKNIGNAQKSVEFSLQSLALYQKLGNKQGVAVNYNNLANAYDDLGDFEKAREFYEKALALNRETKLRDAEAVNLSNLGNLKLKDNDFQAAEIFVTQALQIFRELENKRGESRALVKLGEIYQKKGDRQKALEFFDRALPVLREIEDRDWEGLTLYLLGDAFRLNGDSEKAKSYCLQALEIKRATSQPLDEAAILFCLAKIEKNLGNLAKAETRVESAIEKIETIRARLSQQDFRASYFAAKQDFYNALIEILVERDKLEPKKGFDVLAWRTSEKMRARSFLDSLGEVKNEIRQGVSTELLEKENRLIQLVNAKDTLRVQALQKNQKQRQAEIENELAPLLSELRAVEGQIRASSPKFAALTQPSFSSLDEIQTQILDEKTVLLEYALGEEKSFLFFVGKNSTEVFELPKSKEIESIARNFIVALRTRAQNETGETRATRESRLFKADADADEISRKLSRILLAPVMPKLQNKMLLIVPSGVLQFIPFAALPIADSQNREKFLIETNEIVSLPSASALTAMRKAAAADSSVAKESVAVFADPIFSADDSRVKNAVKQKPIPAKNDSKPLEIFAKLRGGFSRLMFSRAEAEAISGFVSSDKSMIALDFAANLKTIKTADLKNFRAIHFATHGVVSSQFPELSSVVLTLVNENGEAQDGLLRLTDIYNLRLNADVVVLSACDTALGKEIKGEGLIGLTRGFMYAGAKSIAASLWQIDDRATSELMRRFYQKMLKEKLRPADALRQAQIEMIRNKTTRNPFYWAAFTIQGDFR